MRLSFVAAAILPNLLLAVVADAQSAAQNQTGRAAVNPASATITPANNGTDLESSRPVWADQLNQKHQEFIVQLLEYWQTSSDDVKRYECEFVRYEYDETYCNWRDPKNDRLAAFAIMVGTIRFAAPDQAVYQTQQFHRFDGPPDVDGGDARYKRIDDAEIQEKWICDGKAIYEYDYQQKTLKETTIPAELRGDGLVNSPIPFLFGASKEDILSRFWVRIITPNGVEDEYWLEAVPKKIDDRQNYKKLELVLSREDFLPRMLHIFAPNYDAKTNPASRVFEFKNRRVNGALTGIQDFFNLFVRPDTPRGWKRIHLKSLQAQQQFSPAQLDRPAQRPGTSQIK